MDFSSDTIVNESTKKVKDTIRQDNKEIIDRIERVAVAFEKFGQNRSSRPRSRTGDRDNRDSRRGSNDGYSRTPSRFPNRDGYSRRSYSPYRSNSGDRYGRYSDRRDDYRYGRDSRDWSRSPGFRGYRGRNNSGTRYQNNRGQPLKKCVFVVE